MIIKDVLVEINDKHLSFVNPVKVFLNHKYSELIGYAELKLKNDGLYADINLIKNIYGLYFSSIGYSVLKSEQSINERKILSGKIYCISLCDLANEDERIKSIKL